MTRSPIVALADVCESVRYGYTASANEDEVGPRFFQITDIVPDSIVWDSVPFCKIEEAEDEQSVALLRALRHMHFISADVAVPGLNRDFAYSRPLLVPKPRIIRNFLDTAAPLHEQIARLDEMDEKLRTARILLLPRLLSGEIAV